MRVNFSLICLYCLRRSLDPWGVILPFTVGMVNTYCPSTYTLFIWLVEINVWSKMLVVMHLLIIMSSSWWLLLSWCHTLSNALLMSVSRPVSSPFWKSTIGLCLDQGCDEIWGRGLGKTQQVNDGLMNVACSLHNNMSNIRPGGL